MLVALVPIIHEMIISLSVKVFYSFLSITGIILTILIFFKLSRDPPEEWSFICIFKLMFGQLASFQPQSTRSKVVYVILLMFSIFLASELVTNLTVIDLEPNDRLLATDIDDVIEKNISVTSSINKPGLNLISDSCNEKVKKVFSSSKTALGRNIKENEIKITSKFAGEYDLYGYFLKGLDNLTLVDMNLPPITYGISFKNLSPFKQKFADIETWIIEHGLDKKWASDLKIKRPKKKIVKISGDAKVLVINLLFIISIGSMVSFVIFILEIAWYRISKQLNRIFLKNHKKKQTKNRESKIIKIQVNGK